MKQTCVFRLMILLSSVAFSVPVLTGHAEEEAKLSPEQVAQEMAQRSTALRAISNDFAEQQKKTALLKRDRAMFTNDAADPMLTEEEREKIQARIIQTETEMKAIETERVKNRAAFASAAKDYEAFAKKNIPEETQAAENGQAI
ncbi:MAG: hypothetical protein KBC91_00170 [Candidatus Omnitrophica bacterium]|nr:hypothetical protein [Candidatus Omnitrophota bacterium]